MKGNSSKKNKRKSTIFVESEIDLKFRKIAASKFNFSQGGIQKQLMKPLKNGLTVMESILSWIRKL